MPDLLRAHLPWLLSAITIYMTLLAGSKHPKAWALGLLAQALWLVWILASSAWGLLPMNVALWVVYARNHLKWRHGTGAELAVDLDAKRYRYIRANAVWRVSTGGGAITWDLDMPVPEISAERLGARTDDPVAQDLDDAVDGAIALEGAPCLP